MIPSRHDYYNARVAEHRQLAAMAADESQRSRHLNLVEAYTGLAQKYRPRPVLSIRA